MVLQQWCYNNSNDENTSVILTASFGVATSIGIRSAAVRQQGSVMSDVRRNQFSGCVSGDCVVLAPCMPDTAWKPGWTQGVSVRTRYWSWVVVARSPSNSHRVLPRVLACWVNAGDLVCGPWSETAVDCSRVFSFPACISRQQFTRPKRTWIDRGIYFILDGRMDGPPTSPAQCATLSLISVDERFL
jgi:hypothetical protein